MKKSHRRVNFIATGKNLKKTNTVPWWAKVIKISKVIFQGQKTILLGPIMNTKDLKDLQGPKGLPVI